MLINNYPRPLKTLAHFSCSKVRLNSAQISGPICLHVHQINPQNVFAPKTNTFDNTNNQNNMNVFRGRKRRKINNLLFVLSFLDTTSGDLRVVKNGSFTWKVSIHFEIDNILWLSNQAHRTPTLVFLISRIWVRVLVLSKYC